MVTLKYGRDIEIMFGSGEGEIGYAPKVFYIRDNLLAIDNPEPHQIRLFDIKQKKLINTFSVPSGEIKDIVISPNKTICYLLSQ